MDPTSFRAAIPGSQIVLASLDPEVKLREAENDLVAEKDSKRRHQEIIQEASARQHLWANQALRKTTLFPGKQIRGKVSFVPNVEAMTPDTLLLQYGTGDSTLEAGRYATLARYGRIADSVEVKAASVQSLDNKPRKTVQGVDARPFQTGSFPPA